MQSLHSTVHKEFFQNAKYYTALYSYKYFITRQKENSFHIYKDNGLVKCWKKHSPVRHCIKQTEKKDNSPLLTDNVTEIKFKVFYTKFLSGQLKNRFIAFL